VFIEAIEALRRTGELHNVEIVSTRDKDNTYIKTRWPGAMRSGNRPLFRIASNSEAGVVKLELVDYGRGHDIYRKHPELFHHNGESRRHKKMKNRR
jgi:hypothetical protein